MARTLTRAVPGLFSALCPRGGRQASAQGRRRGPARVRAPRYDRGFQPSLFTWRDRATDSTFGGTVLIYHAARRDIGAFTDFERCDQKWRLLPTNAPPPMIVACFFLPVVIARDRAGATMLTLSPMVESPRYARCMDFDPAPSTVFFNSTKFPTCKARSRKMGTPTRRRAYGPTCETAASSFESETIVNGTYFHTVA